jgi:hypothetical protein
MISPIFICLAQQGYGFVVSSSLPSWKSCDPVIGLTHLVLHPTTDRNLMEQLSVLMR